jgi:regulator of sirC expression with transglutaminase-like and TPR domain
MLRWTIIVSALLTIPTLSPGQEKKTPAEQGRAKTVEEIAAGAKPSIAVILYTGRDGKQKGLGTGFVIAEDGLIATNLHVIGEARPIIVQLADGSKHEATEVHASDRKLDLAIVRIKTPNKLTPLPLGDSGKLKQGQPIIALGHPQGLEYSIVSGVLSSERVLDGIPMLQLAIPIEQGNSGGPVLDVQGRVLGIVTMKSLVTANLGFALPVNSLKQILDRPNPVAMEQWLTIGALDKSEWKTMYDARWRQRAGRILADGTGTGFGGRTLCLSQRPVPKLPFELTVTVKLDDEAGAAGLIFGGDGGDKHYGFYPTGGKLRLTRFDGPTVFTWKILHDRESSAYRPGDWNTLRVRLEKDKFTCYVNEERFAELADPDYYGATVGLAKFRQTVAEFKKFQAATKVAVAAVKPEDRAAFEKVLAKVPLDKEPSAKDVGTVLKFPDSAGMLRDRAVALEKQAEQLRKLAQTVHHQRCLTELAQVFKGPDEKVDLVQAALLIARLDNEELDSDAYRQEIDRLARLVTQRFPKKADWQAKMKTLNHVFFKERGFHGSRSDYYARANSYLNEVIDDREGLPITLSLLYMEIARRLDLNVVGVPLPGHFVVRHEPPGQPAQIVDVFEGKLISRQEAEQKVKRFADRDARDSDFTATTKRALIVRMLHNLLNVAESEKDGPAMLRYIDAMLVIDPDAHAERWGRALLRYQAGARAGALDDCERLLNAAPPGIDLDRVRQLRDILQKN